MSDNDLIRRGDAIALMRHDPFLIGVREDLAGMAPDEDGDWVSFHALTTLPAVDPMADPRVKGLVEALEWQASQPEAHPFMAERARAALAAFKGDEA